MKTSKLLYIITAALSVGNVSACSSALECAYRGSIAPTTNTGFTLATGLGGQKARIGGEYTVEDAGQTTTVAIDAKTSQTGLGVVARYGIDVANDVTLSLLATSGLYNQKKTEQLTGVSDWGVGGAVTLRLSGDLLLNCGLSYAYREGALTLRPGQGTQGNDAMTAEYNEKATSINAGVSYALTDEWILQSGLNQVFRDGSSVSDGATVFDVGVAYSARTWGLGVRTAKVVRNDSAGLSGNAHTVYAGKAITKDLDAVVIYRSGYDTSLSTVSLGSTTTAKGGKNSVQSVGFVLGFKF